ncbi:MAG TPA: HD domain-containing phosphohydrolase [Bryobacteraceae bacterium]|nr:HD domain-containing phosphohydrolase [Bryobacteraceae bacterium]
MYPTTSDGVDTQAGDLSCNTVGVCVQAPWHDLLESSPESFPELDGAIEDAAISETEGILFALAQAVEQRDHHTAGHCERLAFMSVAMGTAMGMDRTALLALYRGGYLHDVGKVGIPDSILFKPGKLTAEDWLVMRTHTVRGVEICRHLKSLAPALPVIRHHHERWNGTGYPDGLRGERIPLMARVVQIADIYDALTSPRPYKQAFPPDHALSIIRSEAERGWRDPEVVKLFFSMHDGVISKVAEYTVGLNRNLESMRAALLNLKPEASTHEL